MIALLSVSSLSVASTYAADDFETLLNALNEGSVAEETTAPVEEITAPVDTSGEIDLESMTDVTVTETVEPVIEPFITNTYSNESLIIEDTEIEFEPEAATDTATAAPIFETVEGDTYTYTAARNNRAPQLTVTWMEDAVYVVILMAIIGGLFFVRRRKTI